MSTPRRFVSTNREARFDTSLVTPGGMESDDEDSEFGFSDSDDDDIRNVVGVNPSQSTNPVPSCSNNSQVETDSVFAQLHNDDPFGRNISYEAKLAELLNAVTKENLEAVQTILEIGDIPVDTPLRCGWNALMFACNQTAHDIVYYLLEKGADANYNNDGFSVLMVACASSDRSESLRLKCVNWLIQYKADVNAYDKNHLTALMLAARDGKKWTVECLLRNGANAQFLFKSGWSALHWAISSGYPEVVKILLDACPALEKITQDGKGLVEFARDKDQPLLVKMLEQYMQTKIFSLVVVEEIEMGMEPPTPLQTPFASTDQREKLGRFNQLDTFLCGLKLSHLRPVFHAQEITFSQLLLLKDQDLIQMGIEKLGSRLQIIDAIKAIHKKDWETTSLLSVNSSDLTCPQTVAIVSNIGQHLDYIRSTISYLHRAIRDDNSILEKGQDVNNIRTLIRRVEEATTYDRGLQKEMEEFHSYLAQISGKVEFQPVDFIGPEAAAVVGRQPGYVKWGTAAVLAIIGGTVAYSLFHLIKRH